MLSYNEMALSKKKGSFTFIDPHEKEMHVSRKTSGGGNTVCVVLLDGSVLSVTIADVSYSYMLR